MKNQTVLIPADVLIAILSRLAPDGKFELRQKGVEPEILEDLYDQAKELLRDKVCCGEYATCLRACTPRGKWIQAQESAKLPVDALIYAALLLRLDTGNIESVVNSKTVSEYEREISRLIESVRAAQQEKTK